MSDLTLPTNLLKPVEAVTNAASDKIRETAEAFESTFLAQMMKPMFEGLSTEGPFRGGQAEATWRSSRADEMAKKPAGGGGIDVAAAVMTEMLKMQEQTQ